MRGARPTAAQRGGGKMSEQLYVKRGRRYVPWGNGSHWDTDKDAMEIGTYRLIHCPAPGHFRYRYDVVPATAEWAAAAMLAEHAMQEAITSRAISQPSSPVGYTTEQQQIIEQFRKDMAATGALAPTWWTSSSPMEIARAGVDAVIKFADSND